MTPFADVAIRLECVVAVLLAMTVFLAAHGLGEQLGDGSVELGLGTGIAEGDFDFIAAVGKLRACGNIPRAAVAIRGDRDGTAGAERLGVELILEE